MSEERVKAEGRETDLGKALFRRNRTLTGSSSGAISSANELGGDFRSPRAQTHHLVAHRRRLGSIFVATLIAIGFLTWLLYEFTASVRVVPVTSSVVLQADRYSKIIDDYYAVHPVERLRLLLNNEQLTEHVQREAPEVAAVAVDGASGIGVSQFTVTPRQPIAGWLIGNTQSFVDSHGVAFQINYFEQPSVAIVDNSGIPQAAGAAVASSRFLSFVGRSVAIAKHYGLTVEQAIIPSGTTRQVELRVAGHNYPAKLSLDRPVGEQIEDMQRAMAHLAERQLTPQYIDVRVSGKAFYQ